MSSNNFTAIIVVDFQGDFTEHLKGALPVPGTGKDYLDAVIARTRDYKLRGFPIMATRDYHPADHISFFTSHSGAKPLDVVRTSAGEQVLWPPHCVQGTAGAEILLPADLITAVIDTGNRKNFESYSGFRDDGGHDSGLKSLLEQMRVKNLIIYGLATDYCVQATVLHALEEGFSVTLVLSLSRGITEDGTAAAVKRMKSAGAIIEE